MAVDEALLEQRMGSLSLPLALVLPGGRRIGPSDAAITLRLKDLSPLASIASGHIGQIAHDAVRRDDEITVFTAPGQKLSARVSGRDPSTDLVVLRLQQPLDAPAVPWASTSSLRALDSSCSASISRLRSWTFRAARLIASCNPASRSRRWR